MRYFDLVLTPTSHGIHPIDAELAVLDGVTRDALMHIDAFGDGSPGWTWQYRWKAFSSSTSRTS